MNGKLQGPCNDNIRTQREREREGGGEGERELVEINYQAYRCQNVDEIYFNRFCQNNDIKFWL